MKLKNKKTGEIKDLLWAINHLENGKDTFTLAGLNEEWEDCEEPKLFYVVDLDGEILPSDFEDKTIEKSKELGNYFETREEAEKAVRKLKAWKRLKDKGFRFKTVHRNPQGSYNIYANFEGYIPPTPNDINVDLNTCFGDEE